MFAFLFAPIGVRIVRRIWLYALLAVVSYQLGASSVERSRASSVRGSQAQAARVPSRGYINAPGFHFDD